MTTTSQQNRTEGHFLNLMRTVYKHPANSLPSELAVLQSWGPRGRFKGQNGDQRRKRGESRKVSLGAGYG